MDSFGRISVVGLGYIGLPTAAVFAAKGIEVIGVDVNPRVVATVNSGKPHFGEPNLDALVRRVVETGKLRATATIEPADAFIIAYRLRCKSMATRRCLIYLMSRQQREPLRLS